MSSSPSPARRSSVVAAAVTCQEVRSSESVTVVRARPLSSVRSGRNSRVSLKSLRPPPLASPPSPSPPKRPGTWWVAVSRRMPLSTLWYRSSSGRGTDAPPMANSFSSTAWRITAAATGWPAASVVRTESVATWPGS